MKAVNISDAPTHTSNTCAVEGYASLFGVSDSSGDVLMRGAFNDSLRRRGVSGIAMLFQHDPSEPIGVWDDIFEDMIGLKVRGRIDCETQRGRELASLLRKGTSDGLSIGFKTLNAQRGKGSALRKVLKVDLWEISLVTFPMLTGARIYKTG